MLIAVQGLTLDLIPKLSEEDARELATEYGGLYKRRERLPVQKRILDLLLETAK